MKKHYLDQYKNEIEHYVNCGYGVTYIAKCIGVLPMRLYRWLDRVGIDYKNRDVRDCRYVKPIKFDLNK